MQAGIRGDASEWFTEADYRRCWEVSNLRHYYQRSVSEVSSLPAKAAPLLRDIISKTDSAVAGKTNLAASLRFGHAETVIPLFALMRLPGCYVPDASAGEVAARWCDRDVSPLGKSYDGGAEGSFRRGLCGVEAQRQMDFNRQQEADAVAGAEKPVGVLHERLSKS